MVKASSRSSSEKLLPSRAHYYYYSQAHAGENFGGFGTVRKLAEKTLAVDLHTNNFLLMHTFVLGVWFYRCPYTHLWSTLLCMAITNTELYGGAEM